MKPLKFVGLPSHVGEEKKPRLKSPLLAAVEDWWGMEKQTRDQVLTENRYKERLESHAYAG